MPKNNGDVNSKLGVYRNLCCGTEIVIPVGSTFPDCAKHFGLTTEWKLVENAGRIPRASDECDRLRNEFYRLVHVGSKKLNNGPISRCSKAK